MSPLSIISELSRFTMSDHIADIRRGASCDLIQASHLKFGNQPLRSDIVGDKETFVDRPGKTMPDVDFKAITRELQTKFKNL